MLDVHLSKKELMEFGEYCADRAIKKFCGEIKLKRRMTAFEVADHIGVQPGTVKSQWKKWGLKLIGKGRKGLNIYCGASVQQHEERLKAKAQHGR